jgi:hypothetical protein
MKAFITEHEQVLVRISPRFSFTVDKGLEKIIGNFWDWGLETTNSCIDNNGRIWIEFIDFQTWERFLRLIFKNNLTVNGKTYLRETLWDFLLEKASISISFEEMVEDDPDNDNTVIGTGDLFQCIEMRFPKEYFEDFTTLLFEVLPPK